MRKLHNYKNITYVSAISTESTLQAVLDNCYNINPALIQYVYNVMSSIEIDWHTPDACSTVLIRRCST